MKRSIFLTAGFPTAQATKELIPLIQKSGIDFIELGIPYSDPIADGPVIQASSQKAIAAGTNVETVFEIVSAVRIQGVSFPIILMGYLNPVLQFGIEQFLKRCQATNITAVILPDLPPEEFLRS